MFCSTIPRKVTEFWVWHGNHWILNCHGIMSIELHGNDMVGVTIHQINLMLSVQLKLLRCQNSEQQFDSLISYRDRIESNLQFLGLLILQNAVKPQSYPVIRTLQNADIRTVMVTGKTYISHKRTSLFRHKATVIFIVIAAKGSSTSISSCCCSGPTLLHIFW